jgi:hypothetical protein
MLRPISVALALGATLAACTPTFNWREVQVEATDLRAMLPCKPDKASQPVPMAGRRVDLTVLGCETGGATFAVLQADVGDPTRVGEVLAQWKTATLSNMRSTSSLDTPFQPPGAFGLPESKQVVASGQRPDGTSVESHAAYFARGSRVFQAIIYSDRLKPEVAEVFFSGLRFE